jgi:hypothetical protein
MMPLIAPVMFDAEMASVPWKLETVNVCVVEITSGMVQATKFMEFPVTKPAQVGVVLTRLGTSKETFASV